MKLKQNIWSAPKEKLHNFENGCLHMCDELQAGLKFELSINIMPRKLTIDSSELMIKTDVLGLF